MMSVQELFYGDAEPVWIVNTTAAQVIRHYGHPKPDQYISEQHNFSQPRTQQQNNFQQLASDFPSHMSPHYHQRRQSPTRQILQHQAPRHHRDRIPQKNVSQQLTDQDHLYVQDNWKGQQRQQGPLRQISQQNYHQNGQQRQNGPLYQISQEYHYHNNQNVPPQNSSYFSVHQPSAPPINTHLYSNLQETFGHYARPETMVVRMKVPICCEACEESVTVSLKSIRGVQSVECDVLKEKVTVAGSAAPADILKACKKLFKRSEMWVDSYY